MRLAASIREIGVIEPLVVHRQSDTNGSAPRYSLLDGHLRLDIMKSLGQTQAFCLLAKDDEAFTYNHKVNQVSPIQEHFMILKALDNGVPEERIAVTLNVDVGAIRQKRDLLQRDLPGGGGTAQRPAGASGHAEGVEKERLPAPSGSEMAELLASATNVSRS